MRKYLFWLLFAVAMFACNLSISAQDYKREGTVFVSTSKARSKGSAKKTRFTWKESDGTEYPIYMGASGSCYILRVSKKSGKEYKKYLGKDVSMEISKLSSNIVPPKNNLKDKR